MRILDRWTFGDPMDGDGQELWHGHLTEGLPISVREPLRIGLYAPGRPLDFSTTALCVPIIHGKVKELLEQLGLDGQMQLFPIAVEGQSAPRKVGDAEIFRPWGWQTNIIVSERVKRAMEESGMTGARFTEV
ncbi:hypothetical protein ACN28S_35685 [Cystobacter fuscus]